MATEIVTWCDVHLARDERVPVTHRHVTNVGDGARVIELCEECEGQHWRPLAEFVTAFGVRERDAGKPLRTASATTTKTVVAARVESDSNHGRQLLDTSEHVCWIDGEVVRGFYPYKRHLRDVHGFETPSALAGNRCPVCGTEVGQGSAMASHAQAHFDVLGGSKGSQTVSSLFLGAIRLGDPHGVVADRLAVARSNAA